MRKGTALISTAAAAALVAGMGLSAAPAQAKTTSKLTGTSSITILPEVYSQLGVAGVQFQALLPATSDNPSGTQALHFPVTTPFKPGVVRNTGVMTIGASLNRIDFSSPYVEYPTGAGATTGRITFLDEYSAIGGGRVTVFNIDNMTVKVTKGKVMKSGSAWKRTDRNRVTGSLTVVNDAQFVSALNAYVGATFFTPGMAFGTLNSSVSISITCTSRRECA